MPVAQTRMARVREATHVSDGQGLDFGLGELGTTSGAKGGAASLAAAYCRLMLVTCEERLHHFGLSSKAPRQPSLQTLGTSIQLLKLVLFAQLAAVLSSVGSGTASKSSALWQVGADGWVVGSFRCCPWL